MSEDNRKEADTLTDTETAPESEPFLSRWSRRKALAREGIEPQEPEPGSVPAAGVDDASSAPPEGSKTGDAGESGEETAPPGEAAELPPLESLNEDSDYSAFLAADVAPDMQRQALRKLFRSPKFNLRDGLDDYDLDYSNPAPLGNVVTAEMRHRIAREIERLAARASEERTVPDEAALAAAPVDDPEAEQTDVTADTEPDADDDRSDPA
ncbi:DUF3306 domain-containing protein [Lentisalinibacter sediminis]|uniref:DUF3306 domain-containing protein n=1 Tax=Lentisalinibacter sediminis TaxID=2992237 RepID=UPI00386312ED